MSQRVYMKYPTISGGWDYVQIDPSRASLNMLSELFTRSRQQGGEVKYVSIFGYENLISKQYNTDELDEIIEEVLQPMQYTIDSSSSETAAALSGLIADLRKLKEAFSSIGSGKVSNAAHVLRNVMWSINSSVCVIVSLMENISQEVSGLNSVNQSWQNTTKLEGDVRRWYEDWSVHALEIGGQVDKLRAFEAVIQSESAQALIARDICKGNNERAQEMYDAAVAFLDDPQSLGVDNFCERAGSYCVDSSQEARADMEKDIVAARDHMLTCRDMIDSLHEEWMTGRTVLMQKSLRLVRDIERVVETLKHSRRTFIRLRDEIFSGKHRPFQIKDPPITEADFVKAEELVGSSLWVPDRVKSRLTSLARALVDHLGAEPSYPSDLENAMSFATQHIERIEGAWGHENRNNQGTDAAGFGFAMPVFGGSSSDEKGVSTDDEPRPSSVDRAVLDNPPSVPVAHRSGSAKNGDKRSRSSSANEIVPSIDKDVLFSSATFEQVYELVLCCGYVVTCNPRGASLSNANALLKTVRKLNLVHPKVLGKYWKQMQSYIEESDRCTRVKQRANLTRLWRTARTPWVFNEEPINRFAFMKVSPSAGDLCQFLMRKYGITSQDIRNAKKEKDQSEGWNRR